MQLTGANKTFNPTLVQFKQVHRVPSLGVAQTFQSYLSPIQTHAGVTEEPEPGELSILP